MPITVNYDVCYAIRQWLSQKTTASNSVEASIFQVSVVRSTYILRSIGKPPLHTYCRYRMRGIIATNRRRDSSQATGVYSYETKPKSYRIRHNFGKRHLPRSSFFASPQATQRYI